MICWPSFASIPSPATHIFQNLEFHPLLPIRCQRLALPTFALRATITFARLKSECVAWLPITTRESDGGTIGFAFVSHQTGDPPQDDSQKRHSCMSQSFSLLSSPNDATNLPGQVSKSTRQAELSHGRSNWPHNDSSCTARHLDRREENLRKQSETIQNRSNKVYKKVYKKTHKKYNMNMNILKWETLSLFNYFS